MLSAPPDLDALQETLGHRFADPSLLALALVHRSYLNENRGVVEQNERLEFLGDAVLELVVTEHLYRTTTKPEGELTNWRSALVRREHLADVAAALHLGESLQLSKGEELSGGRTKAHILANAYEAVVGAVFLDAGLEVTRAFIHRTVLARLEDLIAAGKHIDAKSRFQEEAQQEFGVTPEYRLHEDQGPDHAKIFTMGLYIADDLVATGTGASKQAAEQDAAREGLRVKGWN